MKKNNNLIVPIVLFICLIIGCGVIVSNKVLETNNKKEKVEEKQNEIQESKEPKEEKKDIGNPTLAKDNVEKDVEKYIKDEDYEVVSIYSKDIKELYEKYFYSDKVTDNYTEEKITNDMIIAVALTEFTKNNKIDYDDPNFFKNNEFLDEKFVPADTIIGDGYYEILYSNEKLDEYAKKLFGQDVKYNIADWQEGDLFDDMNCCYYHYDKDEKKMFFSSLGGTGCGVENNIEASLEYAYKKDDKLVLIEKSLFFGNDLTLDEDNTKTYERALYNNVKKEKKLESGDDVGDCNSTIKYDHQYCLTKYKDDVTYYAYKFLKNEDGSYYLSDFSRLN